jgi:hypothetical protein
VAPRFSANDSGVCSIERPRSVSQMTFAPFFSLALCVALSPTNHERVSNEPQAKVGLLLWYYPRMTMPSNEDVQVNGSCLYLSNMRFVLIEAGPVILV